MAFEVRSREIYDVVDTTDDSIVTSVLTKDEADGVCDQLQRGTLQHNPIPGVASVEEHIQTQQSLEDQPFKRGGDPHENEPREVGQGGIT